MTNPEKQRFLILMRPVLIGLALFLVVNFAVTGAIKLKPALNTRMNVSYGNFLPEKLNLLDAASEEPKVTSLVANKSVSSGELLLATQTTEKVVPNAMDILFLGTSQTNNGFATQAFESESARPVRAFNLGLPDNRYDIMLSTLEAYRLKHGLPKAVMIELSPTIQKADTGSYYLPALGYRSLLEKNPKLLPFAVQEAKMAPSVQKELAMNSLSSLHEFRHTFSPINIIDKVSGKVASKLPSAKWPTVNAVADSENSGELEINMAVTPEMTAHGWYPKPMSRMMTTPDKVTLSVAEAKKYYIDSIEEMNFSKLERLLNYCKKHNLPVVMVAWPNHPQYVKEFNQSKYASRFYDGVAKLGESYDYPVINLNKVIKGDVAGQFADPRHLTAASAVQVSRELGKQVFALPQIQLALKDQPAEANTVQLSSVNP